MKFKIAADPQFTHPVDVMVPTNGGHEVQTFNATFRVMDAAEAAKLDLSTEEGSTKLLRGVLVKMDDLEGENEQPVAYNDTVRDQLLRLPYVRGALTRTYFVAVTKAKAGNGRTPPATGPSARRRTRRRWRRTRRAGEPRPTSWRR